MTTRNTADTAIPRKSAATTIAAFAVGLVIIAIVLVGCLNVISHELKSSLGLFMKEIAAVESANVNAVIEDKFSVLHGASAFVVADNINDTDMLLEQFREMVDSGAFMRVGIVTTDGRGFGYDSELGALPEQDYADRSYVQSALRGEDCVTGPASDAWAVGDGVVFAVPVYDIKHDGGAPIGALIGTMSVEAFSNAIDASLFEGHGHIDIIDSSGTVLFKSSGVNADSNTSLLDGEYARSESSNTVKDDLSRELGGSAEFTWEGGDSRFVVYEPIGINDWFIGVVLPSDYLEAKNRTILLASIIMAGFIVCIAILLMATAFRTKNRGEKALARAALVDDLTGIDNALAFGTKYEARSDCQDGTHSLVLFNLVGFSLYNTIFGYERGSSLIRSVADILSQDLGKSELLARLSGDRFLMLVHTENPREAEERLLSLLDRIDAAIGSDETHYQIVSQCCVCRLTKADADKDINLIAQDMAIPFRQTKSHAGKRIIFYDEQNIAAAMRARHIEGIMSTALLKEEFVAYFQPQYDIRGGKPVLCGAEALVRWNSPVLGLVRPDEFIPIFEKNGFVDRVDRYMLERACIRLRQWMDAGLRCVPISVNLSRQNLFSADLIGRIEKIVDTYSIPHSFIKLELTESIVAESTVQLVETANKLRERGFRVAMDDFGTGYSALSILKDVPFDTIKLDRAFFGESIDSERGRTTLTGIIQLLDALGFETVAEGIESENEAEQLKEWGCHVIQGYVYGRPIPADEFTKMHLEPAQTDLQDKDGDR